MAMTLEELNAQVYGQANLGDTRTTVGNTTIAGLAQRAYYDQLKIYMATGIPQAEAEKMARADSAQIAQQPTLNQASIAMDVLGDQARASKAAVIDPSLSGRVLTGSTSALDQLRAQQAAVGSQYQPTQPVDQLRQPSSQSFTLNGKTFTVVGTSNGGLDLRDESGNVFSGASIDELRSAGVPNNILSLGATLQASGFDAQSYLKANPTLAAAFVSQDPRYVPEQLKNDPLAWAQWHYQNFGKSEGAKTAVAQGVTDDQLEQEFQTALGKLSPQSSVAASGVSAPAVGEPKTSGKLGFGDYSNASISMDADPEDSYRPFAKLESSARSAAEQYMRNNPGASEYDTLKGIGWTDQDIAVMQASMQAKKAPDPKGEAKQAAEKNRDALMAQVNPEALKPIADQLRQSPEQVATNMLSDLARYGVSDLAQLGAYKTPTGDTVFFNKADGSIIPQRFGTDMSGKGGANFELQVTEGGQVVPSPQWRDTSDNANIALALGTMAAAFAPAVYGYAAGAAGAAGAGATTSAVAGGAAAGGLVGASQGLPYGLKDTVQQGLTGAAIGGATAGIMQGSGFNDWVNNLGTSPSGSFMDPSMSLDAQLAAPGSPALGSGLYGVDQTYNTVMGLGSSGPIGAGSGSLGIPGGVGFNASLGSSNPYTFNADTVGLMPGTGNIGGVNPFLNNQGTTLPSEQASQSNQSSNTPTPTGSSKLSDFLGGITAKEAVGGALTLGGLIGQGTQDSADPPNLPGVGDIGSGGGGYGVSGGGIGGMEAVAERDRQIREQTADQVAPYLANWLEGSSQAANTLNETAGIQRDLAQEQAGLFRDKFSGVLAQHADEASKYGLADDQELQARKAGQTANEQTAAAVEAASQQLIDMGINPNSGRFLGANLGARIKGAASAAGAANDARQTTRDKGVALRANAAGTGLNLTQQAQTGLSQSAQTTNAAANVQAPSIAGAISTGEFKAGNPGTYMQPFQSAINADLGLKNIQASLYRTQAQQDAAESQGWGNLIGTGLGLIFD